MRTLILLALLAFGMNAGAQSSNLIPTQSFNVGTGNVLLGVDDEMGAFYLPISDSTFAISGAFNFGEPGAGILLQDPLQNITGLSAYFFGGKIYFKIDLPVFDGHKAASETEYIKSGTLYKIEGDATGIHIKP